MYYVACFGDSLIQGFPFCSASSWIATLEETKDIKALNFGLCGDCSDDIFERMRNTPLPDFVRHVLFFGGANDAVQGVPLEFTLGIMEKVVCWGEEKHYNICFVLPLISSDEYLNRRLLNLKQAMQQRFARRVFLLDLQESVGMSAEDRAQAYMDGVHPKAATYRAMGVYARPKLLQWLRGQ